MLLNLDLCYTYGNYFIPIYHIENKYCTVFTVAVLYLLVLYVAQEMIDKCIEN